MIYFIYGDSLPLGIKYEELLSTLRKNEEDVSEKYFDFSQKESEIFLETVSQNSMFDPKERLIVRRFESLKDKKKFLKSLNNFNLASKDIVFLYEEFLDEYGRRSDETTADEKKNKEGLLKTFNEMGKVYSYRSEGHKKIGVFYIEKELGIDEDSSAKILELIGEDYNVVKNEVLKLKNFFADEEFHLEKAKKILTISVEHNLRHLIDNFLEKKEYRDLLSYLEEENSYFNFMRILFDELLFRIKVSQLIEDRVFRRGMSYNDFNENYKEVDKYFRNPFTKRALHAYAVYSRVKDFKEIDKELLTRKMKELAVIEYQSKNSIIPESINVEKFLINFFR